MNMRNLFLTLAFGLCSGIFAQNTTVFESPIMGWSSWNTYRVHINDTLIIRQADAMMQKGLKEVGYSYVNVDDGFFGWRDERGVMQTHPVPVCMDMNFRMPRCILKSGDLILSKLIIAEPVRN